MNSPLRRPLHETVIYETHVKGLTMLHPDVPERLRGTYAGLGHPTTLRYLNGLGVTAVELLPIHQFLQDSNLSERGQRNYWGYNSMGFFAPHNEYSSSGQRGDQVAEFKQMVAALHGAGIELILDVVYNHTGEGNHLGPTLSFKGIDNAAYYRLVADNPRYYMDYTGTGNTLNNRHPYTLQMITDSLRYWVQEMHVDGFRFDLAVTLAREEHAVEQMSAFFHSVLTGEREGYYADFGALSDLAATLRQGYRYAGDYSAFRKRRHGRPSPGVHGNALLGYLQNHDQIGNRAQGERSASLMSEGRLMIGAALVLTAPFVPMLFQGEEWAASTPFQYFTDHDAELGRAVSMGRRAEFASFGWNPDDVPDPQDAETFARARLDWSEREGPGHARLLGWHHDLIALRRATPELRDGRLDLVQVAFDEDQKWLRFQRGRTIVAFNIGPLETRLDVAAPVSRLLA